jgi:hypothetical protein
LPSDINAGFTLPSCFLSECRVDSPEIRTAIREAEPRLDRFVTGRIRKVEKWPIKVCPASIDAGEFAAAAVSHMEPSHD